MSLPVSAVGEPVIRFEIKPGARIVPHAERETGIGSDSGRAANSSDISTVYDNTDFARAFN